MLVTLALLICLQFIISNACLLLTKWWAFSFSLASLPLAHPHLNSGLLCWQSHDWNKSCVRRWQRINKADEPWRSLFIHQSWLLFYTLPASACGTASAFMLRILERTWKAFPWIIMRWSRILWVSCGDGYWWPQLACSTFYIRICLSEIILGLIWLTFWVRYASIMHINKIFYGWHRVSLINDNKLFNNGTVQ